MADDLVSLREGGVITVLLGEGQGIDDDYRLHPHVHVVDTAILTENDIELCFVSNSKATISTRFIPQDLYRRLQREWDRRKTIRMFRDGKNAVDTEVAKILRTTTSAANARRQAPLATTVGEAAAVERKATAAAEKTDAKEMAARGTIQALMLEGDLNPRLSTAEEARRLFKIAQRKGITTTIGSVTQAWSKFKRQQGRGDVPASIVPKSPQLRALATLDECMDLMRQVVVRMETIRDFVEKTDKVNETLETKLALMREMFKSVEEA